MPAAANLLKISRKLALGDVKKEMALNLVSATEVSSPTVPNVNVSGLAPNAPTTGRPVQIGARGADRQGASARGTSFKSAGLSPTSGISKAGKQGYGEFGRKLGSALRGTPVTKTNPFGIDPADTMASEYAFKEGGFITKK